MGVSDQIWMQRALALAAAAGARSEVPVGCVVVEGGEEIGAAANARETLQDPVAHAEILALQAASRRRGSWRLSGCDVFVTLEPCLMCAGALLAARVRRVIYAATDPKGGAMGSLYQVHCDLRLNHRLEITPGVEAAASAAMLKSFFAERRR